MKSELTYTVKIVVESDNEDDAYDIAEEHLSRMISNLSDEVIEASYELDRSIELGAEE